METLLRYHKPVTAANGAVYEARACGGPLPGGMWQGWIEFFPIGGGDPLRTERETMQPNRVDTTYWATGVSPVYLEGALRRALAPSTGRACVKGSAVLDPFSVYQKGEWLLRRQLSALSSRHLVNIAVSYGLTTLDRTVLNRLAAATLTSMIVLGVRGEAKLTQDSTE